VQRFSRHSTSKCLTIDINECLVANGDCEHICINTDGTSRCNCEEGYRLQADGQSCSGLCGYIDGLVLYHAITIV